MHIARDVVQQNALCSCGKDDRENILIRHDKTGYQQDGAAKTQTRELHVRCTTQKRDGDLRTPYVRPLADSELRDILYLYECIDNKV